MLSRKKLEMYDVVRIVIRYALDDPELESQLGQEVHLFSKT